MFRQAFMLILFIGIVRAEFPCICSYSIEKVVYKSPDSTSEPVGYTYEFDCKPTASISFLSRDLLLCSSNMWYDICV